MLNYYIAKIRAVASFVDIRVNDLPLFTQYARGSVSCSIPINNLLGTDEIQMLTVSMRPLSNTNTSEIISRCEVSIWLYEGTHQTIVPISEIATISLTKEDLLSTPPLAFSQKIFSAQTTNKVTRWHECVDITKVQDLKESVIQFYQQIGHLLQTKQYDKYAEMISRREKHLITTQYLDKQEIASRQKMLVYHLEQGYTLVPFSGEETLHFYALGKAVSLLLLDYKSALRFIKEGTGEILTINLLLGMSEKDNKLMVI